MRKRIKAGRVIEISFDSDNRPTAKVVGTDEEYKLSNALSENLAEVKNLLEYYYAEFKKNMDAGADVTELSDGLWKIHSYLQSSLSNDEFLKLLQEKRNSKIYIVTKTPYVLETGRVVQLDLSDSYVLGEWVMDDMEPGPMIETILLGTPQGFPFLYDRVKSSLTTHAPWDPLYKGRMVGKSEAMQKVFTKTDMIQQGGNDPVLIVGPTGSGKSLMAETFAEDKEKLPSNLNAGEVSLLSGGEMRKDILDAIKEAEDKNGVLIIDNFEKASPDLQSLLLKYLDETTKGNINCRIVITTTKIDHFEETFLSRFEGSIVEVSPLSERGEDIALLADYFIQKYSDEYKINRVPFNSFIGVCLQRLIRLEDKDIYSSNVRGLENAIKAVVRKRAEIIKSKAKHENWRRDVISSVDFSLAYKDNERNKILTFIDYVLRETQSEDRKFLNEFWEGKKPPDPYTNTPYFPSLQVLSDLATAPKEIPPEAYEKEVLPIDELIEQHREAASGI